MHKASHQHQWGTVALHKASHQVVINISGEQSPCTKHPINIRGGTATLHKASITSTSVGKQPPCTKHQSHQHQGGNSHPAQSITSTSVGEQPPYTKHHINIRGGTATLHKASHQHQWGKQPPCKKHQSHQHQWGNNHLAQSITSTSVQTYRPRGLRILLHDIGSVKSVFCFASNTQFFSTYDD